MMRKAESGQALVLVLLSLSVVLTLVLFILSRSITDVAVSSRQEEAVRAFSAAEAGIERSLVTGASYGSMDIGTGGATYTTTVTDFAEGLTEFVYPLSLYSGDSAVVWFTVPDSDGNLDPVGFSGDSMNICWGESGTSGNSSVTPAIEVSMYYESSPGVLSTVKVARAAFDPFNSTGTRDVPNSFDPAPPVGTCSIGGRSFAFQKSISFSPSDFSPAVNKSGLIMARIRMLYNNVPHYVGVSVSGDTFLSQGKQVDSTGIAGESNRRVVVYQGWEVNPFASNSLFVPAGIAQ